MKTPKPPKTGQRRENAARKTAKNSSMSKAKDLADLFSTIRKLYEMDKKAK